MVRASFSFMNNREILEQIVALLEQFNAEESEHEAFIFLAQTVKPEPVDGLTHDALVASEGPLADLGGALAAYLKNKPREALWALRGALNKTAEDHGLRFILPIIESIFLPLLQVMADAKPKAVPEKKSAIIIPHSNNIREN